MNSIRRIHRSTTNLVDGLRRTIATKRLCSSIGRHCRRESTVAVFTHASPICWYGVGRRMRQSQSTKRPRRSIRRTSTVRIIWLPLILKKAGSPMRRKSSSGSSRTIRTTPPHRTVWDWYRFRSKMPTRRAVTSRRAVQLDPDLVEAHMNLGVLYLDVRGSGSRSRPASNDFWRRLLRRIRTDHSRVRRNSLR